MSVNLSNDLVAKFQQGDAMAFKKLFEALSRPMPRFDLGADPEQLDNVYGRLGFETIQEQLKNHINKLQKLYEDNTW